MWGIIASINDKSIEYNCTNEWIYGTPICRKWAWLFPSPDKRIIGRDYKVVLCACVIASPAALPYLSGSIGRVPDQKGREAEVPFLRLSGTMLKPPKECPNPLFTRWLQEWRDQAGERGRLKSQRTYERVSPAPLTYSGTLPVSRLISVKPRPWILHQAPPPSLIGPHLCKSRQAFRLRATPIGWQRGGHTLLGDHASFKGWTLQGWSGDTPMLGVATTCWCFDLLFSQPHG